MWGRCDTQRPGHSARILFDGWLGGWIDGQIEYDEHGFTNYEDGDE